MNVAEWKLSIRSLSLAPRSTRPTRPDPARTAGSRSPSVAVPVCTRIRRSSRPGAAPTTPPGRTVDASTAVHGCSRGSGRAAGATVSERAEQRGRLQGAGRDDDPRGPHRHRGATSGGWPTAPRPRPRGRPRRTFTAHGCSRAASPRTCGLASQRAVGALLASRLSPEAKVGRALGGVARGRWSCGDLREAPPQRHAALLHALLGPFRSLVSALMLSRCPHRVEVASNSGRRRRRG